MKGTSLGAKSRVTPAAIRDRAREDGGKSEKNHSLRAACGAGSGIKV